MFVGIIIVCLFVCLFVCLLFVIIVCFCWAFDLRFMRM